MVWRIVRKLEKTLNEMSPQIVESNNVAINNSLLMEGVQYIFKVHGVGETGEPGDPDAFAIKYTSSKDTPILHLKDTESDEQFSVMMFGSDVTYADTPYSVEAYVTSCKATNDYYFDWKVFDMREKTILNLGTQLGKKLVIPPGRLVGGRSYDITCKIYHITDKKLITTSGIFITVLKKGLSMELSCENVTIATSVPFSVTSTLYNPDNIQQPTNFNWICRKLPDLNDCESFTSSNMAEINMEGGFSEEGIYRLELIATKGNSSVRNQCEVIVQNAMLPLIDIGSNRKVVTSNLPLEIQSQIFDLRPGCTLQWSILNEQGYDYFDPDLLPDVFQKKLSINSLEETFLSEIVEFGNNTFSRSYPLFIPTAYGSWPGLEPEKIYKFRLTAQCVCTASIQCEEPSDVEAHSDISVRTNGPPLLGPLIVSPVMGTALQTTFTFSTRSASDISSDYPLWYMFGIKTTGSDEFYINHYQDHLAMDTILPFNDSPIIPVLTVCDSRGACDTVDGDQVFIDTPSGVTAQEIDFFKDKFKTNFYRQEYKDAFYLATVILLTVKGMGNDEQYGEFLTFVETETHYNIEKQIAKPEKIYVVTANNLVREATYFVQKFNTVSEQFLQNILKLRDVLFEIVSQTSTDLNNDSRKKRSSVSVTQEIVYGDKKKLREKRDVSLDDVKNFLQVSEFIINTTKDEEIASKERTKMLSNIIKSTPDLCRKTTKYANSLDSQIVHLSFEKIILRSNSPIISIPYVPHAGGKVGISSIANIQFINSDKHNSKTFCLAKYLFAVDILSQALDENQQGLIYYASLYSDDTSGIFKETSENYPIVLKIPIQNNAIMKDSDVYECRRWVEGIWLQGTCETNEKYETIGTRIYVVCRCDNLGYVSLYIAQSKPQPVTEEIIYPEIQTTDVYVTETVTDYTVSQMYIDIDDTTTITNILTTSVNKENVICEEMGCNQTSIVSVIVSVIGLLLCTALIVFIVLKRRRMKKKKINTDDRDQLVRNNPASNGPKYRKFFAEHLMEGSNQSLAKYNILHDMSLEQ